MVEKLVPMRRYSHNPLKYYKLHPEVKSPEFATDGSACFDLCAYIPSETKIKIYDEFGHTTRMNCDKNGNFTLEHDWRAMIPTGLIFDIPAGWVVRLYARSGLALKQGLLLGNSVGIIDSDYVDPVFVIVKNATNKPIIIKNGIRICQGEMCMVPKYNLVEIPLPPLQKTDRDGGFGSTGTS